MEMVQRSLVDLQARIDLSEQEKERVEEMLNTMNQAKNDNDEESNNPDENAEN